MISEQYQLSPNYTVKHVQYNELAVRLGIDNRVTSEEQVYNAQALAENVLEPASNMDELFITSWFRCPTLEREYSRLAYAKWAIANRQPLNETSWKLYLLEKQHVTGQAVSFRCQAMNIMFDFIQTLDFDVLIHKSDWLSVSYNRNGNRKRVIGE